MKGKMRKVGKQKIPIWYTRLGDDGKGNRAYVNREQAEKLMKDGFPVMCKCLVMDL